MLLTRSILLLLHVMHVDFKWSVLKLLVLLPMVAGLLMGCISVGGAVDTQGHCNAQALCSCFCKSKRANPSFAQSMTGRVVLCE